MGILEKARKKFFPTNREIAEKLLTDAINSKDGRSSHRHCKGKDRSGIYDSKMIAVRVYDDKLHMELQIDRYGIMSAGPAYRPTFDLKDPGILDQMEKAITNIS